MKNIFFIRFHLVIFLDVLPALSCARAIVNLPGICIGVSNLSPLFDVSISGKSYSQ